MVEHQHGDAYRPLICENAPTPVSAGDVAFIFVVSNSTSGGARRPSWRLNDGKQLETICNSVRRPYEPRGHITSAHLNESISLFLRPRLFADSSEISVRRCDPVAADESYGRHR